MIELKGEYNKDCKIFIDDVENEALSTIFKILNDEVSNNVPIRIMPDVHEGKGIVIGFTMLLTDRVNPNHVGVDIGCGVTCIEIPKLEYSLSEIDTRIKDSIPMGFTHQNKPYKFNIHGKSLETDIILTCKKIGLDPESVLKQIGTLGGGNHFIEIGELNNKYYLFVHSGSRNFGLQVCQYHSKIAKSKGSEYLFGDDMKSYLEDMRVAQLFAEVNRGAILSNILHSIYSNPSIESKFYINTIHNYIDFNRNIIRKGAVSAEENELLVIPMNMRDGVLLCKGKGNSDWNYSAPHGAGRIMSRSKAKQTVTLEEFEESMKGVHSSCVNKSTLDESPMVYKDMETIKESVTDTVEILGVIKPLLNIKSSE